ncbi:1-aminocyclopropane-1-carboxylate synthase-like protein 1 isoform X5 [Ursus maritimus]|uniref:1-aminocyclopropane-1-carboxylate synthase-like protein 1 isoform X5 n=1 Tax=Ursus maritimus TaxID=29073 RepID=A0A8M1GTQ5_URSMA|nr:1-aminocyclopropane-1-carboxylate synthase-like protein 1 isoform X5 [Ursus maritimus]
MFTLPQEESRAPAPCPSPASTQDLDSNYGDGLERERSRKPDWKLPELCDSTTMLSPDSSYLSSRGRVIKWFWDSAEEGYRTYHMDEYDEDKNPSGIINLGTSENKLCFDLLSRRLSQSDMLRVEPSLLQYPDWRGHPFLREEVARFLSFYCKSPAPLKPENVVVLNGCASLFSALATVLCEVGEAFLIPAPYYGAITQHVYLYGNVRLVCVYLDSEVTGLDTRPFQLTVEKLETALQRANSEGVKVKGLILINPHNPLGDIYSPGELRDYLEFAKRHELHVMVDEVYMLSVFEKSAAYRSVLSLEGLPDPQRTHVMWATSKGASLRRTSGCLGSGLARCTRKTGTWPLRWLPSAAIMASVAWSSTRWHSCSGTVTGSTRCTYRRTMPGSRLPTAMLRESSGPWASPS